MSTSTYDTVFGLNADTEVKLNFVGSAQLTRSEISKFPLILAGQNIEKTVANHGELFGEAIPAALQPLLASKTTKTTPRVAVVPVASEASRHNCVARPDNLYKSLLSAVSEYSGEHAELRVVLCLHATAHAVSSVSALARVFPRYSAKTKEKKKLRVVHVSVLTGGEDSHLLFARLAALADGVRAAQSLVDLPPNVLTPTAFVAVVQQAVRAMQIPDLSVDVISGAELEQRGFGGVWNVGKASVFPPALVHLRYKTSEAGGSEVGLVGKGVCYDSGGLAIKSCEGMCGMKRDMGGAAAVLCGFLTAASLHAAGISAFKNGFTGVHAVLCVVENAVGGNAFRNDDVLKLFSGLTVEVNNTDAEGRLILADGVAYLAKRPEKVDVVMEFATLTGAQGVATGAHHGLLLSNSEELEQEIVAVSRHSGDLVHPMLFCPELHKLNFKSEIADMKNSGSNRFDAQSACAGWFVFENLLAAGFSGAWAHVDMAYPVSSGDRGTGYGVTLITEFLLE